MRAINQACACAVVIALSFSCCKREARVFEATPLPTELAKIQYQVTIESDHSRQVARVTNWYEQNAYALSRGQQLYEQFNCVGCHGHGGGGIGPALSDAVWMYGSDPAEIYGAIMYGRPNGMPGFHGKIREDEAWELAAYVRSIAGLSPKSAAPGRSDEMNSTQPPSSSAQQTPRN